jgi:hypothetical protein
MNPEQFIELDPTLEGVRRYGYALGRDFASDGDDGDPYERLDAYMEFSPATEWGVRVNARADAEDLWAAFHGAFDSGVGGTECPGHVAQRRGLPPIGAPLPTCAVCDRPFMD